MQYVMPFMLIGGLGASVGYSVHVAIRSNPNLSAYALAGVISAQSALIIKMIIQ